MSTAEKKIRMTFEEYLLHENDSDLRNEYYKGEVYAMSGGTDAHSLIGTNFTGELRSALLDKDCFVFGSDLKVRVDVADAVVYPDGMVICGEREYHEGRTDIVKNPQVVIEVLSKGTGGWDRGGKFRNYQSLSSLKEYVLVEQEVAQVDVFRLNSEGFWVLEGYEGLGSQIEIRSLGVQISVERIYHGVTFPK